MDTKVKKREWVKTAAIIFLAVLLVLTFFSNTIRNRNLPEVSTVEVTDGPITAKVRGKGRVTAVGNTEIKSNATTTVASVKVKEGQTVNEGDILFIMGEQSEELEAAQNELDALKFQLMRNNNSYPTYDNSAAAAAVRNAEDALSQASNSLSDLQKYYEQILPDDKANDELENAKNKRNALEGQYEAALTVYDTTVSNALATYEQEIIVAGDDDDAKKLAKDKYDATVQMAEDVLEPVQEQYELADEAYLKLLSLISNKKTELDNAQAKVDSARNSYESAIASYEAGNNSNNKSAANVYIDVLETQSKIEKLEKKIKNLQGGEESEGVKAPVAGIIATVEKTAGASVAKGDILCTIEVPDQGYQVSFSITNDQAKRIKVGDSGSISNYYYGEDIIATVTSIKTDKESPQTKKVVTCDLKGDVSSGAELTVSIGSKSANYDIIVPKSAVRTDSNGTYVLAIESKNSSLGNRYFAKRVEVEELASDDLNVAVSGDLGYGDFVITTSSEKISNKDQVRMADAN